MYKYNFVNNIIYMFDKKMYYAVLIIFVKLMYRDHMKVNFNITYNIKVFKYYIIYMIKNIPYNFYCINK